MGDGVVGVFVVTVAVIIVAMTAVMVIRWDVFREAGP